MTSAASVSLPHWVEAAIEPENILTAKTMASDLRPGIPAIYGGIELTHVGHEFLAYWMSKRNGKPMPSIDDMSAAEFAELLPYVRSFSWEGPERLIYRMFGSALVATVGADITGFNMFDLSSPEDRGDDIARLSMLHAHPCGAVTVRELVSFSGERLTCEMLNLPLAPGADGKPWVMGTVMVREPITQWDFDFDQDGAMPMLSASFVDIGFGIPDVSAGRRT